MRNCRPQQQQLQGIRSISTKTRARTDGRRQKPTQPLLNYIGKCFSGTNNVLRLFARRKQLSKSGAKSRNVCSYVAALVFAYFHLTKGHDTSIQNNYCECLASEEVDLQNVH